MAIQQNISQQNSATQAAITQVASLIVTRTNELNWLHSVLDSKHLSSSAGILVQLSEIPDQSGALVKGLWLTLESKFFRFQALVNPLTHALIEIEEFTDVTAITEISSNLPGSGKSFGQLAIQVLHEKCAG